MRVFKKYKSWSKITSSSFPLRIIKFKKTKWKKIKKILLRTKNNFLFSDHSIQVLQSKTWDRIKNYYNNRILLRLKLKQRYDYKFSKLKNYSNEKEFLTKNFLKKEYRLDLILYNLKFFLSLYQAKQYIKNGFVSVNNVIIKSENVILWKGDIIKVSDKKTNCWNKIVKKELIFSFLEVDYYTKTFVIIKDLNNINFQDIIYNFNEKI